MDERISFGYWVRRRRKALDLTSEELAQQVGCAEVTIRMIEATGGAYRGRSPSGRLRVFTRPIYCQESQGNGILATRSIPRPARTFWRGVLMYRTHTVNSSSLRVLGFAVETGIVWD